MVIEDKSLPGIVYAAYRLTILLPEQFVESVQPGLIMRKIRSACKLFVNGRRCGWERCYVGRRGFSGLRQFSAGYGVTAHR